MSDDASLSAHVNRLSISDPSSADNASTELATVVDDLLNQLNTKFSNVSSELIGKLDEMSRRLDNLEATIQASKTGADQESEN